MRDIILVHNPKCAGSSMKFLLARHCPERWLNPPHNLSMGPGLARAYGIDLDNWNLKKRNRQDDYEYYAGRMDFAFGGQHRRPDRVMNNHPDAFRIGQVRNPFAKMRSAVHQWGSITQWGDNSANSVWFRSGPFLADDLMRQMADDLIEQIPPDPYFLARVPDENIIRVENLVEDWKQVAKRAELPQELPCVNARNYPHARYEFTEEQKKKILAKWDWTFTKFDYPRVDPYYPPMQPSK